MGLFNNKSKVPAFLLDDEPQRTEQEPVTYNAVLDYLVGLSDDDHDKLFKVSGIYRTANKKASEVLGIDEEPTASLDQPAAPEVDEDQALEDDLAAAFLDDDEPAFVATKQKPRTTKRED